MHITDFVILRPSRRIWPSDVRFLPSAAQILRSAQDDKGSARINPNPYEKMRFRSARRTGWRPTGPGRRKQATIGVAELVQLSLYLSRPV